MKLYCFQSDDNWPIETGVVIAENEEQAWKLLAKKYNEESLADYAPVRFEELPKYRKFRLDKTLPLDKPAAWCGECTN